MGNYNVGEVWWTQFPFEDKNENKRRPAIVIDDDKIAVLAMMVTSKEKAHPFCIKIDDWKEAGLKIPSWARIDRIIKMEEWRMERKIGNLTERDLVKFMQLIAEIINRKSHQFSIVAIVNSAGQFLQVYDTRWKCWLFPYFRYKEPNKENIDNEVSTLLNDDVTTVYIASSKHCKYSVSDSVYKVYDHTLYGIKTTTLTTDMAESEFDLKGQKYKWMSINEMESDSRIMEINDDIIAFVKANVK